MSYTPSFLSFTLWLSLLLKECCFAPYLYGAKAGRELRRNATPRGKYVWNKADDGAQGRRKRLPGNRSIDELVKWRVKQLILEEQWSPKQISGYLAINDDIKISHETIYKIIRNDTTGELSSNCRHKMEYHRSSSPRHETKATHIRNRVSIYDRPKEADGKRFGDWEMDLIVDKNSNAILTIVECNTNFMLMSKLKEGKMALHVAKAVRRLLLPYMGTKLKQSQLIMEANSLLMNGLPNLAECACVFYRLIFIIAERGH